MSEVDYTAVKNDRRQKPRPVPICIYHANCNDGFAAAWVVWDYYKAGVEMVPMSYGETLANDPIGRKVIIVDFSFPRDYLKHIAERAERVVLLDHHATAIENLSGLTLEEDNIELVLDKERSGAMLAWDYFHSLPAPSLIEHIQDRDLWKFAYSNTKAIHAGLSLYPKDFHVWDEFMTSDAAFSVLLTEGNMILQAQEANVQAILEVSKGMTMEIGDYIVPAANCPGFLASDVGNLLSVGSPFSVTYYDSAKGRHYSLRSDSKSSSSVDVSKVAEAYGGGGHKHAAGFTLSLNIQKAVEIVALQQIRKMESTKEDNNEPERIG